MTEDVNADRAVARARAALSRRHLRSASFPHGFSWSTFRANGSI
jgi:hypothetical protein